MYLVNGDQVARTKQQLSIVKGNEKAPDPKYIRGNPEHYIVKAITDKKVENRKTYYLTKWKGFTDPTWEESNMFNRTEALRALRKKYNDDN